MKMLAFLALLAAAGPVAAAGVPLGQRASDQRRVFEDRRRGRLLPLREIERRVVPTMGDAQYIGFDFDMDSQVYTLKFLRDGTVIWVDVDGRSGQIVGRTGR